MNIQDQIDDLDRTIRSMRWMQRIKLVLQAFFAYITVAGLVTFSLFILEESFQTVMFGTWPAQDARDWHLVKEGTDLMEDINGTIQTVNHAVGWIQPLAFMAYSAYHDAADYYVKGLRAKVMAKDPGAFDGVRVNVNFKAKETVTINGQRYAKSGRIHVPIDDTSDWQRPMKVDGYIRLHSDGKVFLECVERVCFRVK